MKNWLILIVSIIFFIACKQTVSDQQIEQAEESAPQQENSFYEMRVYYAADGKLAQLQDRFRNHTMDLFEKHGMQNVIYWTPVNNEQNTLVYLLSYPDRESRDGSWKDFGSDPEWQKVKSESEVNGSLVDSVKNTFMHLTDYSPALSDYVSTGGVYELRTYYTHPGKLSKLHDRFENHTMSIFDRLNMKNVLYWDLDSSEVGADHTMIYLLKHADTATLASNWQTFINDPEWKQVYADYTADGRLVESLTSESLIATDFSPIK